MTAVEFISNVYKRSRTSLAARRADKQMRLIETLPLGGKRQLMLVECGEQRFLVGASGDGVQTIIEVAK